MALVALTVSGEEAPKPDAAEIMHRVAQNQDKAQQARNQFVYEQKLHRVMRRKDGKLLREEYWTYSMVPGSEGTQKKVIEVHGRYWKKGNYLSFEGEPVPETGLVNIILDDDSDNTTRDGIDKDLFPLTTDRQKNYAFELTGERIVDDRPAYQIRFRPADPHEYGWTGEALIDKSEFQPVTLYTRLSRKLPLAVRTMLGTDVPGLGYNIQYTRIDKDIWFPSSYGTEFSLHALFFLNRTFTESTENSHFRRTTVETKVDYSADAVR